MPRGAICEDWTRTYSVDPAQKTSVVLKREGVWQQGNESNISMQDALT